MKYLRQIIFGCFITVIIGVSIFWMRFLSTPIITNQDFHYILKPGSSAKDLASDLQLKANLKHPFLFRILVMLRGDSSQLQAGEYLFPVGYTSTDVIKRVVFGDVVQHAFTIVNGWNFTSVMNALNKDELINHVLTNQSLAEIAKKLNTEYKTPEGLFFPDTYNFALGATDLEILQRAYKAMQDYLATAWQNRANDLPYKNSYQALIVASMIEKETSLEQEKPLIAAIILNRLKKWIPLQIDSSVIYGLGGKFDGGLTKKDLQHKTPYNTYVNYGLPPTPISIPGKTSIQAALHPSITDMMYFVSKGDGSHVFSKTLETHDAAVERYQLHDGSR